MTEEAEETDAIGARNQISYLLSAQLLVDFLDTFSYPNHRPILSPLTVKLKSKDDYERVTLKFPE